MKVTLHIGTTRTGSSALQAHLFQGRHRLARAGILYPDVGTKSNAHHILFAAVHPWAWGMHKDELSGDMRARNDQITGYFKEIFEQADATGARHVILSSEYLWGIMPEERANLLARHLKDHEVHLVCALRRQDKWLESSYLQTVKRGEKRSFDEWLQSVLNMPIRGTDFLGVLDRWNDALAPASTTVLPYEFRDRTEFTRRMVDAVTGQPLGRQIVPSKAQRINVSPDAREVDTLLEVTGKPGRHRSRVGAMLRKMNRAENPAAPVVLTPELQADLLARYADTNAEIARKYAPSFLPALFSDG